MNRQLNSVLYLCTDTNSGSEQEYNKMVFNRLQNNYENEFYFSLAFGLLMAIHSVNFVYMLSKAYVIPKLMTVNINNNILNIIDRVDPC